MLWTRDSWRIQAATLTCVLIRVMYCGVEVQDTIFSDITS